MRRRSSRRWSPRVGGESAERPIALTIGTAGHVDHGKTTLVRYMTGTDTDRLEEEHRRGISIVPGYAELTLPSGRRASLVDVPGHERFVKNMVAGSTGVDAFLLVVAADDGVMPQTREHLDVLRVLGVRRGVVALTKIDTVDEETVELAELDAAELLESAGLEAPIIPVSGVTGEGVDRLLLALDDLAGGSENRRTGTLARLPVDRAFVLKGIGLVATGTLWSGEIRPGDTLYTTAGHRPRVRGIQNHGRPAEAARAGARTALDLVGIGADELEPGDVLLSRPAPAARALDARVQLLESAYPLNHGTRLRLYHGTRATNARVRLLDRKELIPGESALARLVLQEGLVVLPGDRFVLRSSSATQLSDFYVLAEEVEAARTRLLKALKRRAEERPESPELSVAEARTVTGLHARLANTLLAALAEGEEPQVRVVETGVSLPDADEVPPEIEKEAGELLENLQQAGAEPPAMEVTAAARLLLKRGRIVRLDARLFAAAGTADAVLEEIKTACWEEGEITLGGFRDRLGTSRKYAQVWLEYSDEIGVTRRVGDTRVLTRR